MAVTIYSNGVALVQDTRQLALPAGVSRQEFPDVSNTIRPATVRLSAPGTEIVEQNYDYDLLSPSALMAKAVGQTITLVRTNPATGAETREQARVLASNGGVVMQVGGHIEVLRDDGLPVRVVFDTLPPNLRARPTLSITLDSKAAGTRPVTISYLTGGLTWSADYVALFDEAKGALDMQGWITLGNSGEVPFVDADTVLVAGAPGDDSGGDAPVRPPRGQRAGTETADRARLGDFYLYPLGHRTTIAANQQKQVSFLSAGGVPAHKGYEFRNDWLGAKDEAQSVDAPCSVSRPLAPAASAMRCPPAPCASTCATRAASHSSSARTTSTTRRWAPSCRCAPARLSTSRSARSSTSASTSRADEFRQSARYRITAGGNTRDVRVDQAVTYWRTAMRYVLSNATRRPVTVDLIQSGLDNGWEDTRVSAESQPGEQRSIDERVWHVAVPANGETTLTATFDTRY